MWFRPIMVEMMKEGLSAPAAQVQRLAGLGPATSRSTLQYSLKRLKAAGLIEEHRDGRRVHYWAKSLVVK